MDYVYVLYKCSTQVNYRKEEVSKVVLEILDYLNLLYHKEAKGFSFCQQIPNSLLRYRITKELIHQFTRNTFIKLGNCYDFRNFGKE